MSMVFWNIIEGGIKHHKPTNFIVIGLTRPVFEPMTYRTLGNHTNHYSTDAVNNQS